MEKLRDETLDQILKSGKTHPHEVRLLIPELKLLRDIHSGKRPPEAYGSDAISIHYPRVFLEEDNFMPIGDAVYISVGTTKLVRWSAQPERRYIIHRVK
jgi:hypothetical protein